MPGGEEDETYGPLHDVRPRQGYGRLGRAGFAHASTRSFQICAFGAEDAHASRLLSSRATHLDERRGHCRTPPLQVTRRRAGGRTITRTRRPAEKGERPQPADSPRARARLWTVTVFTVTLVATTTGVVEEGRQLLHAESARAAALLEHLARMPKFRGPRTWSWCRGMRSTAPRRLRWEHEAPIRRGPYGGRQEVIACPAAAQPAGRSSQPRARSIAPEPG